MNTKKQHGNDSEIKTEVAVLKNTIEHINETLIRFEKRRK